MSTDPSIQATSVCFLSRPQNHQQSIGRISFHLHSTMMFAGHATRVLATATLRSTCTAGKKQFLSTSKKYASRLRSNRHSTIRQPSTASRHKSTAAAVVDDDSDNGLNGHSTGETRASINRSHEEGWMINLGRGNDNEWLTGPRPQEWFTGLPPSMCPGK